MECSVEYALENKTSTSNKDSHGVNKVVNRLRTKGGQKLLNWAMENFEEIDKTLLFVPHKDTVCLAPQCGQHIKKSDAASYCHALPFHEKCLTQVPGGKPLHSHYVRGLMALLVITVNCCRRWKNKTQVPHVRRKEMFYLWEDR